MRRQNILLVTAVAIIAGVLIAPWPLLRYMLAFPLLWLLPGQTWLALRPFAGLSRIERVVIGLGLSFAITIAITLLTAYLPGPVSGPVLLLALLVVGFIIPAVWAFIKERQDPAMSASLNPEERVSTLASSDWRTNLWRVLWQEGWFWLLLLLLIGASMRLVNLQYAEFQGDEAAVMTRAARALMGDEAILFQHRKGPAELMLVMAGWAVTGVTTEWMARLPFALASLLGIAVLFLMGRRLSKPRLNQVHIGVLAAMLLAVEGYLTGFGRIVQYQSLVVAFSALALMCLYLYQQNRGDHLVILAAIFYAGGALAHYDAILALPAGLWLIGNRLWRHRARYRQTLKPVIAAAVAGGALLGLFYVPFLRSPQIGTTVFYVSGRLGGGQEFFNHLPTTFERSAVYDSIYFLVGCALLLGVQTLFTWRRWGRLGLVVAGVILAAAATGLIWPGRWVVEGTSYAWVPVAFWLIGSVLVPGSPAGERAVWLWWGIPSLFYLYLVAQPLTHVYALIPAAMLLAGWGVVNVSRALSARSRPLWHLAQISGLSLYALSSLYVILVFVNHVPEYRRTFPESKLPLFWTPYEQIPPEGLFGFPYQAGWKTVGYLMDTGALFGTFDSNEEKDITDYYAGPAVRLGCATPDLYVTAVNVQDEVGLRQDQLAAEYGQVAEITVSGQPRIRVYQRHYSGTSQMYRAEEFGWLFAQRATPVRMAFTAQASESTVPTDYMPREALLGGFAHLLGYQVDTTHATPGGYVELTVVWEATSAAPIDYQVFTHLHDGERMRGQLDGQPTCGNAPTSRWQPGQLVLDPYRIPIQPDAPLGPVPLTIGMYNLVDLQRVPVSTLDGSAAGDNVFLTDVEIREP